MLTNLLLKDTSLTCYLNYKPNADILKKEI